MKQTVKSEARLRVKLGIIYPDINKNKSYPDSNRNYTIEVNGKGERKTGNNLTENNLVRLEDFRLRALIVIRKKYRNIVDSTFTYRVGENFAKLKVGAGEEIAVAIDFTENNSIEVLTDCSHIRPSLILN